VRLSIRWRLTLWNTLALAVLLACFAALIYGLLRHALFQQTDRSLQIGFGLLRADPRIENAPNDTLGDRLREWIEEFKEHQNLLCVIYRADGVLHDRTEGMKEASLPPPPPATEELWVRDERLPEIGRHRVMAERLRLGRQDYVVMLLAPLETVDRELDLILNVILLAGPIALLLSAGLAYWLARKALAPVGKLRRDTDAITADRLGQRLAASHPHDELGLLTRTINAMLARLDRSFAEVRRFTADASHELRTPLTVLRTEVEVALGNPLSLVDHQQLLGNILDELVRMSRLTDQLLTLSRRDAGVEQMVLAPLDLHRLVSEVVEAMRPMAEAKEVLLQIDGNGPVEVAGNEGLLRQVFINLLDNALKYTPNKGRVTVRVEQCDRAGVVIVEDTGIGIPSEHLPHVFDRFYRVDKARSRSEGGTGLGLSIAQSIAKAHGGTIEMTSTVGKGTVCMVTLPPESDHNGTERPEGSRSS
jgi:two-component system, OmpR family, heavy metal sensor histidine kinase CusS